MHACLTGKGVCSMRTHTCCIYCALTTGENGCCHGYLLSTSTVALIDIFFELLLRCQHGGCHINAFCPGTSRYDVLAAVHRRAKHTCMMEKSAPLALDYVSTYKFMRTWAYILLCHVFGHRGPASTHEIWPSVHHFYLRIIHAF